MPYDGGIKAMQAGALAYNAGVPKCCNPYAQTDVQHYDWSFGWDTAMTRSQSTETDIH